MTGRVAAIYISATPQAPMDRVDEVEAVEGVGLAGDRYGTLRGTFSKGEVEPKRHVTLFEREAIDAVNRDYEIDLRPEETRRNVMTEGVALNHLVGVEFAVGQVRLRGVKLCEPCQHLQKLAGKPLRKPLVHRGGLRAEIVAGGTIRVGDAVSTG